jgi:hypothetical protein
MQSFYKARHLIRNGLRNTYCKEVIFGSKKQVKQVKQMIFQKAFSEEELKLTESLSENFPIKM